MDRPFVDYVDMLAIVKILATLRARRATVAHANEFYTSNFEIIKSEAETDELNQLLPTRRNWARPNKLSREGHNKSKEDILRDSIVRKVQGVIAANRLLKFSWGCKLQIFVDGIVRKVKLQEFKFSMPTLFLKSKECDDGEKEFFRCISKYDNLEDRVVLMLANKYCLQKLDRSFSPFSCAFRTTVPITNNTAVSRLARFRKRHPGRLYVANCDIKNFFDRIPHATIMKAVLKKKDLLGKCMIHLIQAYLNAYDFEDVRRIVRNMYPDEAGRVAGIDWTDGKDRGIPQGGALSSTLANLVLDELDKDITARKDRDLFYARYCDDILIAHTDKTKCEKYLKQVLDKLDDLGVPAHDLRYVETYKSEFYDAKSRSVYTWAVPDKTNYMVPWVPFLGYCISATGEIRIRKETLMRHRRSMVADFGYFNHLLHTKKWKDRDRLQRVVAQFILREMRKWIGSIDSRGSPAIGHCWIASFPLLENTPAASKQMRYLDYWRAKLITGLLSICQMENVNLYLGYSFSYLGSLKNACRRKWTLGGRHYALKCRQHERKDVDEVADSKSKSTDDAESDAYSECCDYELIDEWECVRNRYCIWS